MEGQTAPLVAANGNKSSLKVSIGPATLGAPADRSASPVGTPQVRFKIASGQTQNRTKRIRRRTASSSSHLSESSSPEDESVTLERRALDGGWGWVVVAAAFVINMIADGITLSFGIFFVEFLRHFGSSKSTTSWLGSIFFSLPLLLGPVASSLVDRFGCRKATIAGSLLSASGFILSYLANSMELLFITFSVMPGIGLSLCYVCAVVMVAYYFERRRSLALGISVCGTGVGTFVFPPLCEHLIQEYGWRGALLILSGIFLNMTVCGMLMRDLDWMKHKNRERASQCTLSAAGDSESMASDAESLPDIEWLRNALNAGDVVAQLGGRSTSKEQLDRLHSSALQLPTWIADSDVSPEVRKRIETDRRLHALVSRLYPHLLLSGADCLPPPTPLTAAPAGTPERQGELKGKEEDHEYEDRRKLEEDMHSCKELNGFICHESHSKCLEEKDETPNVNTLTTTQQCRTNTETSATYTTAPADASAPGGGAACCSDHPLCLCLRTTVPTGLMAAATAPDRERRRSSCDAVTQTEQRGQGQVRASQSVPHQPPRPRPLFTCEPEPSAAYLHNMKLRRQSMTYRGAMLHIHRYRLRASSCPDIYRNSMITILSDDGDEGCWSCLSDVGAALRKMVDMSFFRVPAFTLFTLSNFVLYMFYDAPYVYLADHAISRGTSDEEASVLISVIGFSNVIGVLLVGYAGDRRGVSTTALYVTCMVCCGVSTLLVPSCDAYWALILVCTVFGFCISANYTLAPTILVDLISIDNFTNAYGLLLLAQGLANLVGPPLCGLLRDLTSSYVLTFRLSGAAVVVSGLLLCLARAWQLSRRIVTRVTAGERASRTV